MTCASSGSLGEEVVLVEKRLQKKDIEEPPPEQLHSSEMFPADEDLGHSGREQEQEFISRVFSQPQGPRVHWGSPPRNAEAMGSSEEPSVEEVTSELSSCGFSNDPASTPLTGSDPTTSPPPKENKCPPSAGDCTDLKITQVGVSKRGAAGLQDLLRKHSEAKPDSLRQNLVTRLRTTLKEWCTESTLDLLYGTDRPPAATPFTDPEGEKEEELDEDDLDDEAADGMDAAGPKEAPSPVPDFEALRKDTQEMELRVREFYKGTWILPDRQEEPGQQVSAGVKEG